MLRVITQQPCGERTCLCKLESDNVRRHDRRDTAAIEFERSKWFQQTVANNETFMIVHAAAQQPSFQSNFGVVQTQHALIAGCWQVF